MGSKIFGRRHEPDSRGGRRWATQPDSSIMRRVDYVTTGSNRSQPSAMRRWRVMDDAAIWAVGSALHIVSHAVHVPKQGAQCRHTKRSASHSGRLRISRIVRFPISTNRSMRSLIGCRTPSERCVSSVDQMRRPIKHLRRSCSSIEWQVPNQSGR